ncbi:probable two-component response regulator [Marinomonas sp. MED121]|uniref:sigma-54 interaction domain-containing protein n=1 Tax=Marinomonas sp. MED121 TaxID=314277 RepID=UPI0000690EE1|nr:sigma-54 dependent transcriptional regulator [Marinomonas sp. MED121]EAQ64225.1 probable two-component response regulator [Marinomonas sp. MED121]
MKHILFIHNNTPYFNDINNWLVGNDFLISEANSIEQADSYYQVSSFDAALITQDCLNSDSYSKILSLNSCPTIALDDKPSLTRAVELMAAGAHYYLPLPTDPETLIDKVLETINKFTQQTSKITKETPANKAKTKHTSHADPFGRLIGNSAPMKQLFRDLEKIACTDVTVLVRGESGTGKELVAKAIHDLSERNSEAMVSVNCAAIPESLIESELFGHEKGAFTGAASTRDGLIAAADNGTLFLDEIGELPIEAQARLLRVLQEGEIRRVGATQSSKVNIRLVTATHRDLRQMVADGLFREDLYYRLYVMEVLLPPLRDRGKDISLISQSLVGKVCKKHNKENFIYSKEFDQAIIAHHWPGNVRELENAIERAVILSDDELDPVALKIHKTPSDPLKPRTESGTSDKTLDQNVTFTPAGSTLDDYLKSFVLFHQNKMTETQLASNLGISRKSLWERRQKLGIQKKSNT